MLEAGFPRLIFSVLLIGKRSKMRNLLQKFDLLHISSRWWRNTSLSQFTLPIKLTKIALPLESPWANAKFRLI